MAKYLIKATYTAEGSRGLIKEGGSGRRKALEQLMASVGGRLDAFYYAFGEDDVYLIAELPDHSSAMALSIRVAASGGARSQVIPLVTSEEVDLATKKSVTYRPPGA